MPTHAGRETFVCCCVLFAPQHEHDTLQTFNEPCNLIEMSVMLCGTETFLGHMLWRAALH